MDWQALGRGREITADWSKPWIRSSKLAGLPAMLVKVWRFWTFLGLFLHGLEQLVKLSDVMAGNKSKTTCMEATGASSSAPPAD
ncbi:hypothetical protein F2Q70_00011644 [Brassica cretica]|uniref:Uncharacterized protein n=1 Tax=Brassica cretica TaxID=69181 RepID=A0A8S9LW54_BRACR|nr:hypothetical protein F2Q70_00011644 [Brassica cretica]